MPISIGALAPPLWLFLGASNFDSFQTFYQIRASWRRHGLTLLDRTNTEGLQFHGAWRSSIGMPVVPYDPGIARIWSLRTRPGVWPAAFRLLCTFAPVIVVDRRHMSEIVQFEVSWLERRDFVDKVYAVVSPEDARKAGDSTAGMKLVDEETLIASQWTGAGLNC